MYIGLYPIYQEELLLSEHHQSLPLKALSYFAVVAQVGSFKRAADKLCVTPQAISIQMKALEQQLGVALFSRHASGVVLTPAGELLAEYVERGLALLDQGVTLAKCTQKTHFRINISPWFAVHRVLPLLETFESKLSDVELFIGTQVAMSDSDWRSIDLAIQWGFGEWPAEHKHLLQRDDKYLVCAPALKARSVLSKPEDLQHQRIICTPLSIELWQRYARTLGIDLLRERQFLIVDSIASQVEATKQGLGVALVSDNVAQQGVAAGEMVMPLGDRALSEINPSLVPGYWLVIPTHCRQLEIAAMFESWLTEALAIPS